MECISSLNFSIVINGTAQAPFKPSRGLRQGDPLSPYIVILSMKPLIRNLNQLASRTKNQVGIPSSPHGLRIANLMFADDCLIFGTTSPTAAKNILRTHNDFSNVSGQHISYHKSTLYFSGNVTGGIRTNISQTLGIQHKSTIGRYDMP